MGIRVLKWDYRKEEAIQGIKIENKGFRCGKRAEDKGSCR